MEMGFEEAESIEALRMFRNDQDAAVSTASCCLNDYYPVDPLFLDSKQK